MTRTFTLGRTERLKSRKALEQLFEKGFRFHHPPYRVYYSLSGNKILQLGVGVSTRQFKKSTDRNRVKRLLREAWRLQKNPLQVILRQQGRGLQVFISYTKNELPLFPEVMDAAGLIVQRLREKINENTAAGT